MQLITAKTASQILGVSLPRVYELARLQAIPSIKLGRRQIRFSEEALAEWARQGGISHNEIDRNEVDGDD
jgi:excisionase family DNA binding protein